MQHTTDYFSFSAKIALWVLAGLLPIWFVPVPIGVEFGREITFGVLIFAALILWLLSVLTRGEFRYVQSPILWATGLLVVVFSVSAFYSASPFVAFFLAPPAGERVSVLVLGVLLMVVAGAIFTTDEEVEKAVGLLLLSTGVSAALTFIRLAGNVSLYQYVASFAQGIDFNAVGSANALAVFYAVALVVGIGILVSRLFSLWPWWKKILLLAVLAFLFADLVLINFQTAWVVVLGAMIFLWGFLVKDMRKYNADDPSTGSGSNFEGIPLTDSTSSPQAGPGSNEIASPPEAARNDAGERHRNDRRAGFGWRYAVALGCIAFALFMVIVQNASFVALNLPVEVSPTLGGTWTVSRAVLKQGAREALLGSGPGTFGLSWSKYKDPAINQTQFWALRFNQGSSWFSTLISTTGILGVLAFLLFIATALAVSMRPLFLFSDEEVPYATALLVGFGALCIAAFVYPANLTFLLAMFLCLGLLSVLLRLSAPPEALQMAIDPENPEFAGVGSFGSRWDAREREVRFESPWSLFLSSLVGIFFLALAISFLYFQVGRTAAAYARQSATDFANQGKIDESIAALSRAIGYEDKNFINYELFVQAGGEKIRGLIQQASQGKNVQQEFQQAVSATVQQSQQALGLYGEEPILWRTQGALYELLIPFVDGAQNAAFASYQRAAELDPLNPLISVELGRARLVFADRIAAVANQAPEKDRAGIQKAYTDTLDAAKQAFQKAIELKSDFASAHFLLTQAELRLGNLGEAIRNAENAKRFAPNDIGVAFQLGLLYYQQNDFERSRPEFERAVAINENYSNARYFLGLVYDRQGQKDAAIAQFEKIAVLNPDNQEVKGILENLRAGRGALEKIVPPAAPPEKRREEPVRERGQTRGEANR